MTLETLLLIQSLVCKEGYKLQGEMCVNLATHESHHLLLANRGHPCPAKYTIKIDNYCVPIKK